MDNIITYQVFQDKQMAKKVYTEWFNYYVNKVSPYDLKMDLDYQKIMGYPLKTSPKIADRMIYKAMVTASEHIKGKRYV